MDYFLHHDKLAALEARLQFRQPANTDPAWLELAWQLRQRDGERSEALVARLAQAALPLSSRGRLGLIRAELALLGARFDEARQQLAEAEAAFAAAGDSLGLGDAGIARAMLAAAGGDVAGWRRELEAQQRHFEAAGHAERARLAAAWANLAAFGDDTQTVLGRVASLRAQGPVAEDVEALLAMTEGYRAFDAGSHGAAIGRFMAAFEAAERMGLRLYQIRIAFSIAAALSNLEDMDAALPWLERSLELARAAGWPVTLGEALATLGNFYRENGYLERGQQTLAEALRWLQAAPDSRGNGLAHCYAGHAELAADQWQTAIRHGRQAERIARAMASWPLVVDALVVVARAASRSGDAQAGFAAAREAQSLADAQGLAHWWIVATRALAELHACHAGSGPQGGARAALDCLQQASVRANALGSGREGVELLVELAAAFERVGDLAQALVTERQARAAANTLERQRLANRMLSAELRHELELQRREAELQRRLANTDVLTGIPNRRCFLERMTTELGRCRRSGRVLSLVMADIDRFKSINDSLGHAAGDVVIAAVAQALAAHQRAGDSVGRLGGEEFALLLPDTDLAAATLVAERLRAQVQALLIEWSGQPVPVTMSFGCSDSHGEGDDALGALMHRADQALYEAKRGGRNRVALLALAAG
ncbi:GGDEF domain-containing protein [Paucibacter sp. PLA-PC-4]|uniref:GGDEF domain-containing protein n=1 Tax=Paucibacter sp. PLA-PC-4 TaxID=2993655 RepID=UPI002248D6A4|nr:GGDEF domain-containing protein [Paucibacter sp. PLA-PC-4]MCX2862498.1 GGDEF domain-containing protein [Paucibacter sp. PLA-PC-4]